MLRQDLTYLDSHNGATKHKIDTESDRLNDVVNTAPCVVVGALLQVSTLHCCL